MTNNVKVVKVGTPEYREWLESGTPIETVLDANGLHAEAEKVRKAKAENKNKGKK